MGISSSNSLSSATTEISVVEVIPLFPNMDHYSRSPRIVSPLQLATFVVMMFLQWEVDHYERIDAINVIFP